MTQSPLPQKSEPTLATSSWLHKTHSPLSSLLPDSSLLAASNVIKESTCALIISALLEIPFSDALYAKIPINKWAPLLIKY